jgi:hypothetical protein
MSSEDEGTDRRAQTVLVPGASCSWRSPRPQDVKSHGASDTGPVHGAAPIKVVPREARVSASKGVVVWVDRRAIPLVAKGSPGLTLAGDAAVFGRLMEQQEHGACLSVAGSTSELISLLRGVNRRKTCIDVLPLDLKSLFSETRADRAEFMPDASLLVSSAEIGELAQQQPIRNPARHWREIIVGSAAFLLLAGTMAFQFRASIATVIGSEPQVLRSVLVGSSTSSSVPPNRMTLQNSAAALGNSLLVPANPSSSVIPTKIQPLKDASRLPGAPKVVQQPASLTTIIDFAQISKDRPGLLATGYFWLAERNRGERALIAPTTFDPELSGASAILYEEGLEGTQEKQFHGRVDWRTELSPRPGRELEFAVVGEIAIPERKVHAIWSLRRKERAEGAPSHAIEITFEVPPDYPLGQIVNVPGVLARQAEQAVGDRLEGKSGKASNGFRIDLSPLGTDWERNVRLLKERPTFEIPIAYAGGRRGLLTIEKGTLGDQAFSDFFLAPAASFGSK